MALKCQAPVSSRLLKRVLDCKRRHILGFVRCLGMLATCVTGDTGARSSAMSPPMRRHAWAHISALATSALDAVREKHAPAYFRQPAVRTGREEDSQLAGTGRHATIFP